MQHACQACSTPQSPCLAPKACSAPQASGAPSGTPHQHSPSLQSLPQKGDSVGVLARCPSCRGHSRPEQLCADLRTHGNPTPHVAPTPCTPARVHGACMAHVSAARACPPRTFGHRPAAPGAGGPRCCRREPWPGQGSAGAEAARRSRPAHPHRTCRPGRR